MNELSWPLLGLAVHTPALELRYPSEKDLFALAAVAAAGIHGEEFQPFFSSWTKAPSPYRERDLLQREWRYRGAWTPEQWILDLVVVVDGAVVGLQGLSAEHFSRRRCVGTTSWLGLDHQGRGIGTEMRVALLHLAFAGLGAQRAQSSAHELNQASLAVSRKLGYVGNGDELKLRDGKVTREVRMLLTRERWEPTRRHDIVISGLAPCLELFGLPPASSSHA